MLKPIKNHAVEITFLALAVIFNAFMDVFDFRFPRGSGFWSIDESLVLDAWHLSKYLMWAAVVAAVAWKRRYWSYIIVAFVLLNYALHELILHGVFG